MRELIGRLVARLGADLVAASRPNEALYLLSSVDDGAPRKGLALLDVVVPGLEGSRFVDVLRADRRFASAPIVLLSGLSPLALEQTMEAWKADGFIPKSRGLLHVGEALHDWLERLTSDVPFVPRVTSRPPDHPGP
jgi:CheY-like chemotaxis protein